MAVVELGRSDPTLAKALKPHLKGDLVSGWWMEIGHDSNGFPAVWVWLVVPDRVAADPIKFGLGALAQKLESVVRTDGRFWPYVYFRSDSEQRALRP